MIIAILFKNGKEIQMKCETFKVKRDPFGGLESVEFSNPTENRPMWLDLTEVAAIYRVGSTEGGGVR